MSFLQSEPHFATSSHHSSAATTRRVWAVQFGPHLGEDRDLLVAQPGMEPLPDERNVSVPDSVEGFAARVREDGVLDPPVSGVRLAR